MIPLSSRLRLPYPRARVAIVTGSASGIGRATADLLGATDVLVAGFDLAGEHPVDVRDGEAVADEVARVHDASARSTSS